VHRRRVLVVTPDTVTERMAGPAIRSWHIAADLAAEHDVTLLSTQSCTISGDGFRAHAATSAPDVDRLAASADVAIVQGDVLNRYPSLGRPDLPLVVDMYDPFLFEQLEQTRQLDDVVRMAAVESGRRTTVKLLLRGDTFLCASEKQRDLWIGHLAALGRVNPLTYAEDPTLRQLVRVVPFGIPDHRPEQRRHAIKGTLPEVGADDLVVLWGGGVYDWLDPITVVEAVGLLRDRIPQVRLVFLGMQHPNPDVPVMAIAQRLRDRAAELGLTPTHVQFVEGWVPYDERADWLLDADVTVSAHLDHIETAYAFRTRILDTLWAGVPVVATGGDTFGDLIERYGLGRTVPPGDVAATAAALEELLLDATARRAAREAIQALAPCFAWHRVLAPLRAFCGDPHLSSDRADPRVRRQLRRQVGATGPRNRVGRELEILQGHRDNGGLSLAARRAVARLNRTVVRRR
jgi:glycosyltransferase involved in cell wall biosynthesis